MCGRSLSLSCMSVCDCAVLDLAFVSGKEIFIFESSLIAGAAACSKISWDILSPLDIWNLFWLLLTRIMVTFPWDSGSSIPAVTSTLCVVAISVRGAIRPYSPGGIWMEKPKEISFLLFGGINVVVAEWRL